MTTGRINQVTILNGLPRGVPRYPRSQAEQFTVAFSGLTTQVGFSVSRPFHEVSLHTPYRRVQWSEATNTDLKPGSNCPH